MKNRRVLLDTELAPMVLDLFKGAGMDADIITPNKRILKPLMEHGNYSALMVQNNVSLHFDTLEATGKRLKVIGVFGDDAGNVDVADASRMGILIKVTEYGNTFEAAGQTLRLMATLLSRSFQRRESNGAMLITDAAMDAVEDSTGFELAEMVLGLIGCGNVAQALASRVHPHCKRVIGYDNHLRAVFEHFHRRRPLEKPVIEYGQLSEVLEYADVISIHTAGDTRVFKGNELYFAKQRPFIINTSRDGNVDEAALLSALKEKRIRGAALTVDSEQLRKKDLPDWAKPFIDFKNVIISPGIGTASAEAERKQARILARSIIDYLLEKDLSLAVNPMDVVAWRRKQQFPISRGVHSGAVPMHWNR